ncbi:C-glycoside deglycosidase beta subunit domain-containing protein [Mesobacterium pallidum]|uniref:C-glycoside deglycosidase beta subunit domain-containing protein n=1 Tax=Mesobacterium pallidum TaxID=2872037 RepID=UPI001EE1E960|nr:DUF6379 domain-containing protein [Mesobacterium pallidum]
MLADVLIDPDTLKARPNALSLGLRLPWYQSLPLSVIRIDGLSIDGVEIDADRLSFSLNGRTRPLGDMADLTGEYWFLTDTMEIAAPWSDPAPGRAYECVVRLSFFPPYAETLHRSAIGQSRMRAA